ncbi:MAG: hypothetical protein PHV18_14865 [Lachnospiraceae bacterium]|nr:hypothetical protein [Lachnospiraceae bacterium]
MKSMKNLSFDDGYESFTVNDDPNRVIRFNPADPEIINRVLEVRNMFQSYQPPDNIELNPDGTTKGDLETSGAYIAEFTKAMREAFNGIFLSDVYDTIFAGQSPLCIVGQKYLFEGVLDGLLKLMKPAVEAYGKKNEQKLGKYLKDVAK